MPENIKYRKLFPADYIRQMVIQHKSRRHTLAVRSVVALGRNTSVLLEPQAQQSCQLILLFLHHAPAAPNINLNFLCLHVSLVDVFFGRKTRFCILTDQEHIYVTFHAILYEWEHDQPERDTMLTSLLQEFFIRLARSFHAHNHPTGIQYLTSACDYIKQNFQEPLTLKRSPPMWGSAAPTWHSYFPHSSIAAWWNTYRRSAATTPPIC